MSLLKNLKSDSSIESEKDSLGGGVVESGIYLLTINTAYLNKADSGALALVLNMSTEDGREIRQSLWMTSGTAKGGNNYYIDKNGNKQYLPGFNMANSLCLLIVGKEISDLDTEKKVINVYSSSAKAEVPTQVDMLMDLLGKTIQAGIIKQIVDKTQKTDAGTYVPTGETREENEIDKLFRASDSKTTSEIRAQADSATFIESWRTKWTGKTKDKSSKTPATGAPKAPGSAPGTPKPTTSLFG